MNTSAKPAAEDPLANEPFRLLVESVTDYAIFMLDPTGHVRTWNPGAAHIKGYAPHEIIGHHFSRFYTEEEAKSGKCEFELAVAERTGRFEDEGWRVRKDGSRFWANVIIAPVRGTDGRLRGFAKVTRDLTERREAAERLRQSEERLRLLVENIEDYAVFMLDHEGRVSTWNRGAQKILQYRTEEILGQHFSRFAPPEATAAGHPQFELDKAAATGRHEEEGWRVRKDGSRFWSSVVISAIRDTHGHLVGFAKVTRDLTERKQAEHEQAARVAAEQANRAKDEFLAMLGHELRNPLAPTLTALQLMKLRGEGTSREQQIIERQLKHMIRLVDDLLDVARITRGTIELTRERIDLREVIARAIEMTGPLFEERRHDLAVNVPAGAMPIYADPVRMAQVFANLLTNAAKYTNPGGHISIAVRSEGPQLVCEVRDDGTGIAPDLLPRVFESFVQAPQSTARAAGGLGIGLALVRSFVQLHGGTVEGKSPGLGQGSVFTVRLPRVDDRSLTTALDHAPEPTAPAQKQGLRVLVVDDNEDALILAADVLRMAGHQVWTASDPRVALDLAGDVRPDVAVLDLGLPGLDGYELAERLRARLPGQPLRLVAMTGYGQAGDLQRSRRAGFEIHLVKPVDMDTLIKSVQAS